jgi:hypothetical protein
LPECQTAEQNEKGTNEPFPPLPGRSRQESGTMSEQDAEIEWLKASVNCATLLERLPPV